MTGGNPLTDEELLLDSEAWEGDEDLFLSDGTAEVERLLDTTTTATRHASSQILVDAHRRLPLVCYDTEVLIEW